jgi:guanidinobutyrase
MMRLPHLPFLQLVTDEKAHNLDVCFLGIPLDIGTSNRSGTRYGPRQIRQESSLIRPYNMATRAAPFDSLMVADVGDVPINTFNLSKSVDIITDHYQQLMQLKRGGASCNTDNAIVPLTLGGDHTLVLPILRAVSEKYGPVSLLHIDAHSDTNDHMFGERIAHGTPIRRAVEEGLIHAESSFQIGLRGSGYASDDFDWARKEGMGVVPVEECWHRSLSPLMDRVRETIGPERPVYISYDIDSLDPAFAPGTGTPGSCTCVCSHVDCAVCITVVCVVRWLLLL